MNFGMIIGKSLLKYKEGDPDVVGSFSMNRDENLTVVANRKNISDKEAFARLLLKMYKENSFHSIKFSTDHGYATSLDMTVYSWKEDIENGESIMQIEFRPATVMTMNFCTVGWGSPAMFSTVF